MIISYQSSDIICYYNKRAVHVLQEGPVLPEVLDPLPLIRIFGIILGITPRRRGATALRPILLLRIVLLRVLESSF